MATHDGSSDDAASGFVPFFRSYTKTWIHTVATAGLTAFGTLTFVHRWFAALALASYVVPPIVLYVRKLRRHEREAAETAGTSDLESDSGYRSESAPESGRRSSAGSRAEPDSAAEPGADPRLESEPESRAESKPETARDTESEATVDPEPEPEPKPDSEQRSDPPRDDEASAADPVLEESRTDRSLESDAEDERTGVGGDAVGTDEERPDEGEDESRPDEADGDDEPANWHRVDTSVSVTLFDDVVTAADERYAVGAEGVVVAETGQGWTTVLEDGPAAQGNALRGVDATAEGDAVWVAGDGGAVGRIDAETGRHTDYTAPADRTDNLAGIAVGGESGDETVLVINGSGEVLRGRYEDGSVAWDDPVKPGSGSSLVGVTLVDDADAAGDDRVGYCCDTNDGVFETDDGGRSFSRIGLEGADGTLEDIATSGRGDCLVSADDGVVHRYGGSTGTGAGTWTPERVADAAVSGIARRGERTLVCADDGTIHERAGAAADWERFETDASGPLHAVSLGPTRALAVGADGTIIERDER